MGLLLLVRPLLEELRLRSAESRLVGGRGLQSLSRGRDLFVDVAAVAVLGRAGKELDLRLREFVSRRQLEPFLCVEININSNEDLVCWKVN